LITYALTRKVVAVHMKKQRFEFRTMLALILVMTIILLPFDTLALTGQAVTLENMATSEDTATPDEARPNETEPDEAEPTRREKDDDLAQTGANILDGDGTEESPYIIASSDDWDALSESINSSGTDYSGKFFKMTDDISVSTVLGNRPDSSTDSNDNYFSGTFDGGGHELNVNIDESGFGAAPFAIAHNATIKNLHVTGTVKSGANHATGLVAASKGRSIYDASYLTIQNVTVSTAISCPSHVAGIVGHAHSADITMENVVFDGSLNASNIQGGMIGWGGLGNGARFNASFKDCVFAGTYNTSAAFYPVAFANGQGTATLINDFYTTTFGGGGSPIQTTGDGQVKLLAAQVEKDGAVSYFDNINTAADGSNWTQGSTLKLMADVSNGATITVPSGEHTLDLNGHGIKMTGSGSVISVGSGAVLDLTDSDQTRTHKFDVPDGAGLATLNETSGNYTVSGGYITGGNANPYGGGVRVAIDGKFNMYGGTIIGNTATSHGGGVSVSGTGQSASSVDNFKMYGGAISYNTANWGGGIGIYGNVYIYDTSIISNNTANSGGGGIELEKNGRLYMCGGNVTENMLTAMNGNMWKGGGIHVPSGAQFHFSGSPHIKDNYQSDGTTRNNVFVRSGGPIITVDDTVEKDASVGVTLQVNTGVVTSGWNDKMGEADPSKYFTSDDNNYQVFLNGNGEAEIGVPPVASVINGDTTTNYGSLSDAVNAWTQGSTLKLLTDVTTGSTITVPSGEHTLDLNGYGILMTGNDRVVTINQGASLELNDSDPDRIHYITLTNYRGTAVSDSGEESVSNGNGVIKVTGGYLTGGYRNNSGSHDRCGAGVYNWGTFVMNGGSIVGNTLYNNSGGAIRNSGYFTMNGGTIAFNYASGNGGGVTTYVPGGSQGKMTMNGGEISDNYCGNYGGGIQIAGPIEMTGGSVVRNTAGAGGSGVFYDGKNDRFKLSGNPVIKDNSNNDDLYLGANATFMINGSLTEEADIHVLMNTPAEFTVGWKNIMGDADPSKYFTSDDSNYAVILNDSGELEIAPPPVASIISGETTTKYSSVTDAVNAWTAGSTLKLLDDITTGVTITVPTGEHILDLNGHTLKAGSTGYSVITVGSGADLTIDDTTGKDGKITGGSVGQNFGGGVTVDGGKLTLKGGAISGNANTYNGIGNCGGGIHVKNGGAFYMEGGEISDNTSYVGGGVGADASDTTVVITGGVIKNNQTDRFGSAIWAGRSSSAVFRIGGDVQIIDNISTWTADKDGEASVNYVGALLLSGNPTVHGDWKTSGTSSPNTHINLDNNGSGIQTIELDGELTNDTGTPKLTISPIYRWGDLANGQTFVFTKNWNQYMGTAHPADYFKVDDSVSGVKIIRKNGEAAVTGSSDLGDLYITFDANEGKGTMDPQLVTATNATLNKNTFTRDGYAFAGWNTEKDGSGTGYSDKASVTLTGDLTLYAQWKEPAASIISGETTTDYVSVSDAVSAWTAGSTLKLLDDVSIDTTITVPSGEHTLDLNGHGILMTGNARVLTINQNASLELNDSDPDRVHYITLSNYRGTAVSDSGEASVSDGSGVIKVTGGYLTGGYINNSGSHDKCGAGVFNWGTFVMNGGSIVGNFIQNNSGAGVRNSGTFTMNDGTIAFNKATGNGGGVTTYVPGGGQGKMTMTGGVISDNYCGSYGGGIQLAGPFELTGGSVIRNTAGAGGSGIYYGGQGEKFKLSGDPVIKDNINNNLYLNTDATFMINGSLTEDAEIGITMAKTASFTVGWNDNMGEADPSKYFTSDNDDYIVDLDDSGEACLRYPDVPDVSAEGFEGDYDGATHSITVSAPDGAEIKYGTSEGSYTLSDNPTYTDAGTYTVYYEAAMDKRTSVYGSAVVKIDPINVTVTITGHTGTVDYDGTSHRVTGYDAVADTELYDVTKDFSVIGLPKAERTDVGTTIMGLEAARFENTNSNFENVVFLVTDGYLTVDPVDAVITTAPHAKSELVYNDSEQELIAAGSVDGGTLYYAIGKDYKTSPDDNQYKTALPVGKDIGNYYIWYKVKGDSNHNDLSPTYVKITMADQGWGTVSGGIADKNNNPVSNATVSLMIGGKVIDEIISGSDGSYYFTVPAGIYNIVVKSGEATVTEMVDVADQTTYNVSVLDSDTDSLLDVVDSDSDIVVGGLSQEAALIRDQESVPASQNVTVKMTVRMLSGSETDGSTAISDYAPDKNFRFYDFKVEKTVDSQTTLLDATQGVLEIAIPCSFTNKSELAVYNNSSSGVDTLTQSDSKAVGTYRVDQQSGIVYIYTDSISTYAIGYKPYYSVKSEMSLGSFSGNVSVKLTKDATGETFELNNVSLSDISFSGIPKGTYSMTITWTDGAENTITTPFIIK